MICTVFKKASNTLNNTYLCPSRLHSDFSLNTKTGCALPDAPRKNPHAICKGREFPIGNFLFFVVCMMNLLRLPRGKLPLAFLAVPAGKDGRVECPCQTVNDFIGIGGNVCWLFLFVQTHAPLIVPPWQSRARKSKFQFLSGARARMFSALHLRLVARWWLTSACRYAISFSFSISSNCAIYALCCLRIFSVSVLA